MFYVDKLIYRFKLEDFSHSVNRNRMAGRVNHWMKNPDRPSIKGVLLILPFEVDVKRRVEEGKDFYWPRPRRVDGKLRIVWQKYLGTADKIKEKLKEGLFLRTSGAVFCRFKGGF
jgi:hypothetical protein